MRPRDERRRPRRQVKLCCPAGHPYEGDNLVLQKPRHPGQAPWRKCRICVQFHRHLYSIRLWGKEGHDGSA